ncbi:hypothetical protein ACWDSL_33470 [Streptomyces sp. NPDC000941]
MKATQTLHKLGQSLWLDNITRGALDSDRLQHYIDNYVDLRQSHLPGHLRRRHPHQVGVGTTR